MSAQIIDKLSAIANRFQGVDLQYRRDGVNWPNRWRAVSFSCKHDDARCVAYGDSMEEAIDMLDKKINGEL